MNIILDTSTLQQKMSGTGYYTLGMLRELLKMDSVDVVQTLGGDPDILQEMDHEKMTCHFTGEYQWHRLLNWKLAGNRSNIRGDLAIFPNYFMPPVFSIPSLVTIHDLSFLSHPHFYNRKMRTYYRYRIKHTFSCADRILTVSRASRKNILEYSNLKPADVLSIPPGPSLPEITTTPLANAPSGYFLWNGNIEPRKNVLATLRAFLEADQDTVHLVIAGKRFCSNRYWKTFQRLVQQSNRIHYLGYVDNAELKQWYAGAKGIIYCSHIEGLGIPVLNGRSMNKPCLISGDRALQEAAGMQAVVVNPKDQQDISIGFRQLATLAPANHQTAEKIYSVEYTSGWNHFSDRLEELIHQTSFNRNRSFSVSFDRSAFSGLETSILKTLAYSAVFEAPIQIKECYLELQNYSCSYEDFLAAIQKLRGHYPELITRESSFMALRPYVNSIGPYRRSFSANRRLIRNHRRQINQIARLPWISGIYFSGGTVHASHISKADIDLFIITASNRTWLAYSLLKLFALCTGTRNLFCFNYLIDRENLQVRTQQDLYTAHQILHLKPAVFNRILPDLKANNPWIYDFFPNSRVDHNEQQDHEKQGKKRVMELINLLLMAAWSWLWGKKGVKNRTGGIRWDAHQIKLHTHDHRPRVYEQFEKIQKETARRLVKVAEAASEVSINRSTG